MRLSPPLIPCIVIFFNPFRRPLFLYACQRLLALRIWLFFPSCSLTQIMPKAQELLLYHIVFKGRSELRYFNPSGDCGYAYGGEFVARGGNTVSLSNVRSKGGIKNATKARRHEKIIFCFILCFSALVAEKYNNNFREEYATKALKDKNRFCFVLFCVFVILWQNKRKVKRNI